MGGDGDYSFSSESSLLKAEMTHPNYILFEPLGVGDATVTIKDSSGNSYILNITVTYMTQNILISELEASVVGDQMTVAEQKELKTKALETIPVKIGSGYRFIYTGGFDKDKIEGIVLIYPDKFGENPTEGTFEQEVVKRDDRIYSHVTYTLHYGNTDRTFIFMEYRESTVKSSPTAYTAVQFAEDLIDQYQAEYPNAEQVYTSQIIGSITTE